VSPLRRALSFLGAVGLAAALAGVLAPAVSRALGEGAIAWAADLATHWVWLWWPLGALSLLLLRWRAPVRLVAALVLAALPWAWLPPALEASSQPPTLRVAVANVHLSNRDPAPLLAWARNPQPDVLAVLELTPAYAQALSSAGAAWPHHHLSPQLDAFGIGLLSRWPLRDVREVQGEGGILQLHARVMAPFGEFELIAVHPVPPIDSHWHAVRDRTLAALRPSSVPAVLVGDFNATPWSSAAPRLAAGGWRWFGGLQPTWPHGACCIPIDAVWAHGPWQLTERSVGPPIGSDHRPVRAGLRLTSAP
jgi:endonuclease/exonuclease/phosphatase (EEP) superfamily protein YafD